MIAIFILVAFVFIWAIESKIFSRNPDGVEPEENEKDGYKGDVDDETDSKLV